MNRRILSQGHFDGLCLLYSIMNAYKALYEPRLTANKFVENSGNKWKKLISISPSLENFVSGKGSLFGLDRNHTDVKIKEDFINNCFMVLTERKKQGLKSALISIDKLISNDFSDSVLILCAKDIAEFGSGPIGEHWVAIIGIDHENRQLLVCCSCSLHDPNCQEIVDMKSGRAYNNTLHFSELTQNKIFTNGIHKVCVSSA